MSNIPILDLNEQDLFRNFVLYLKGRRFSTTRFIMLIFCNILHLEMNFGNLY